MTFRDDEPALRSDRRTLLRSMGVATAAAALGGVLPGRAWAQPTAVQEPTPLWRRAADAGVLFGSMARSEDLADVAHADALARDCLLLTSNEYSMNKVRGSSLAQFDFAGASRVRNFAVDREMVLSGANLVWDRGVSEEVVAEVRRRERARPGSAEQIMRGHISACVSRAEYRMHSWNVVNEPISTQQGRSDGLRDESVWFETIGPDYIGIAFHAAANHNAQGALLMLNEFGLETGRPPDFTAQDKRAALLGLLQRLLDDGAPITALGLQGHLSTHTMRQLFNEDAYRDFLADVAGLGLKILVTELDVRDNAEPTDFARRDAAVAAAYAQYLRVTLDEPAVIAVSTWGFADHYSWLQVDEPTGTRAPRTDGQPLRPLLVGPQLGRKQAWWAAARAFEGAPRRGPVTSPVALPARA